MVLALLLIVSAGAVIWKLHGGGGRMVGGPRQRAVPVSTKQFKVVDDDAEVLMDDADLPEAPRPKKSGKPRKGEGRASGGEKKGKKSKKQSSRGDDESEGGGGGGCAGGSIARQSDVDGDGGDAPVAFGTRRKSDSGAASEEPRRSGARRDSAASSSSRATSKRSKQEEDDVRLLGDADPEPPRRGSQARGGKTHAARIRAEFYPGPTLD